MTDLTITAAHSDVTADFGPSPSTFMYWTGSALHVYQLSIESGALGYKKSTNGGTSFGTFQTIDNTPSDYGNCCLWAQRWTNGQSDSSTLLYVIGMNQTNDEVRFFTLDVSSDTVGGDVQAVTGDEYLPMPDGNCSICEATNGDLYVLGIFGGTTDGGVIAKSTDSGATWDPTNTDSGHQLTEADCQAQLLPLLTDDDVLLVYYTDSTTNIEYQRWDAVGETWSTATEVSNDPNINSSDGTTAFSCTQEKTSTDIHLISFAPATDQGLASNRIEHFSYDESADSWSSANNVVHVPEDMSQIVAIRTVGSFYDEVNGILYAFMALGGFHGGYVYASVSSDKGLTWSKTEQIGDAIDDFTRFSTNFMMLDATNEYPFPVWYDEDSDDIICVNGGIAYDTKSGVTKDNSTPPVALGSQDVMMFKVSGNTRKSQGHQISDATTGAYKIGVLDLGDNAEYQAIFDKDGATAADDQVDASHREVKD